MPFSHGIEAEVFLGAYDMGGFVTDHGADQGFDQADSSTINNVNNRKTYVIGQGDGTVSLQGLLDTGLVPGDQGFFDSLGGKLVITYGIAGVAIGDRIVAGDEFTGAYQQGGGRGGLQKWSYNGQSDKGLVGGVSLHANATETGVGAFASADDLPAGTVTTAFGGFSALHVIGGTYTSATIEVEDSTDDAIFATLTSHALTGANVGEVATVAGTVNRYLRANITAFVGTDITFVLSFARYLV